MQSVIQRDRDLDVGITPFYFFTPVSGGSPIGTVAASSSTTVINDSLPINTRGIVTHIGVDFLTADGSNELTFSILKEDAAISTFGKKYLFQSIPDLIPIRIGLESKTNLKVIAYNNSAITVHRVKVVVIGYFWYLGEKRL